MPTEKAILERIYTIADGLTDLQHISKGEQLDLNMRSFPASLPTLQKYPRA